MALFFCFAWFELISESARSPGALSVAILIYSAITWLGMAVFGRDVWLARGEAFSLAFLDPHYGKGLGEQTLDRLREGNWLASGAIVVLERGANEPDIATPGYVRLDQRTYGAAEVLFLRHEGD